MQLKSIELQGFKSFPDKTTLTFDADITAVVGPNGSGKSNISDAVKWVFGEQSVKSLRGGRMEDVIFGGTQLRKSMGYASVTLTLDNQNRIFACDSDTVAITRRLYRTGESEYRLNGAGVRLKDIHELLMDTGLGRDGYSIVSQGRIADLISAKSRDRREIFDEAAGISKFRHRRTEAERRLASAEENMLRLRDIFAEIEAQIGPLERESKKAAEFLKLSQEVKELEISIWMESLSSMASQLASLDEAVFSVSRLLEEAERKAGELELEENENSQKMRELLLEIEEKRLGIADISERVAAMESQCAVLQNDKSHNERAIAEARDALQMTMGDREAATRQLEEAVAERESRRQERENADGAHAELARELETILSAQRENAEALDELRLKRSGLFEVIELKRRDASATAAVIEEAAGRVEVLAGVIDERKATVYQITKDITSIEKEIADGKGELSALENTKKGFALKRQNRLARQEGLIASRKQLEDEAAQKRQRAQLLSEMQRSLEGFAPGVKHIVTQQSRGIITGVHGPISSLVTVPDDYVTAIEVALGAAVGHVVVEDEAVAKRAITMLSNSKVGRATFLPLSSVKGKVMDASEFRKIPGFVGVASELVSYDAKYAHIIAQLIGRVIIAETLDDAQVMAKRSGYRQRVVTLDGQVINAGGSYTGGYIAKSTGTFSRQKEIDALLGDAAALVKKLKSSDSELAAGERELRELDASIAEAESDIRSLSGDLIRAEAELEQYRRSHTMADESLKAAVKEREEQAGRIENLKNIGDSDTKLAQESDALLEKAQSDIEELSKVRDALAASHLEITGRISGHEAALAIASNQMQTAEENIKRLQQALAAGESRQGEIIARIADLEEENAQISRTIAATEEQEAEARGLIATAQEEITGLFAKQSEREKRASQLREQERFITSEKEDLIRRLTHSKERRGAVAGQKEEIIAKLWESYEMTLTDAEQMSKPLENKQAATRKLSDLKGRIRGLGHVNLGAIEAYNELNERHVFLGEQMADVDKSRKELTRLINDLSKDMRALFSEKFANISRYFSEIFVDLFDGGRARLHLSDPDDLLESGVEIEVQPPGKLIKNLSALSGGEQAFVAIAIFLSILKVNPAPFCLFDEIEAALDEVNVSKYAAYLRRFTDDTQFILITHRRGTMEEADVLYGVAMQEEGVSKLLRLSLSEAQELTSMKTQS